MSDASRKGVCLDTSFLITLCGPTRPHHGVARQYFQYWLEHEIPVFLPTICYAEFLAREVEVPAYVLNRMNLLAFDPQSAVIAGEIERKRLESQGEAVPRDALKDDIKIIANACQNRVLGIATEDEKSMVRFARRASDTIRSASGLKTLLLADGFNEGSAAFSDPELPLDFQSGNRLGLDSSF